MRDVQFQGNCLPKCTAPCTALPVTGKQSNKVTLPLLLVMDMAIEQETPLKMQTHLERNLYTQCSFTFNGMYTHKFVDVSGKLILVHLGNLPKRMAIA